MPHQPHSPSIALLPLDSRPVCTQLPQQLAAMAGITLHMPKRADLNHLKTPAQFKKIEAWLNQISERSTVILATDTLAYGGLIPSRQGNEDLTECKQRIKQALSILHQKQCHIIAFSSIMRTPNYNNAEEEPEYWATYGKALHAYSAAMHKEGKAPETLTQTIPKEVLTHFLETRARNFELNQWLIEQAQNGQLHELTFCLDDSGEYGLNKAEASTLKDLASKQQNTPIFFQTGADEVACSALSRTLINTYNISDTHPNRPSIWPIYSDPGATSVILKFDGIPVQELIERHIQRAGGTLADHKESADVVLLVHTPPSTHTHQQGDWCEKHPPKTTSAQQKHIQQVLQDVTQHNRPMIICDIAAANGSDPKLIFSLLQQPHLNQYLYGYGGWNTPGNATGTALSIGVIRWLTHNHNHNDDIVNQAHQHALFTRLADDWLYQAEYRRHIPLNLQPSDAIKLNLLMANGLQLITNSLNINPPLKTTLSFPCQRRFEIEINLS